MVHVRQVADEGDESVVLVLLEPEELSKMQSKVSLFDSAPGQPPLHRPLVGFDLLGVGAGDRINVKL